MAKRTGVIVKYHTKNAGIQKAIAYDDEQVAGTEYYFVRVVDNDYNLVYINGKPLKKRVRSENCEIIGYVN